MRSDHRLLKNISWQWLSVLTTTVVAFILPRLMIRSLGQDSYGLWVLAFSLIEYVWIFDVGFTPAVQNAVSRFNASDEQDKIGQVVNTAFFFFLSIGGFVGIGLFLIAPSVVRFFDVPPAQTDDFRLLFLMVGFSFVTSQVLRPFGSALEGLQRFDLTNRTRIRITIVRGVAVVCALYAGASLIIVGLITVVMQALSYWIFYLDFRKALPAFRVSPAQASVRTLRQLASYGVLAFFTTVSGLVLGFSAPVIIGRFRPVAEVGYYSLITRIVQQFVVLVDRAALALSPMAADQDTRGNRRELLNIVTYVNRYAIALFVPVAVFLLVYGYEFIALWINPQMAANVAPLIPVVVLAAGFAQAGQATVGSVLFGLAELRHYSRAMFVESVCAVLLSLIAVPRYGLLGVATVYAGMMVINRGLIVPAILCRHLSAPYGRYLSDVYVRPLLCCVPILLGAHYLKTVLLPGTSWLQLIAGGAVIAIAAFVLQFQVCLLPRHKDGVRRLARATYARF